MRTKLKHFLKTRKMSKSKFAREIGSSPQLVGVWERHESKDCIVHWDPGTGEIQKVTLEKVEVVYEAETESEF